jgi:hypothetical protein
VGSGLLRIGFQHDNAKLGDDLIRMTVALRKVGPNASDFALESVVVVGNTDRRQLPVAGSLSKGPLHVRVTLLPLGSVGMWRHGRLRDILTRRRIGHHARQP